MDHSRTETSQAKEWRRAERQNTRFWFRAGATAAFVLGCSVGATGIFWIDRALAEKEIQQLDSRITETRLTCLQSWSASADLLARAGVKVIPLKEVQ